MRKGIWGFALVAIVLLMASCSSESEYANAIPKDAAMVMSFDFKTMAEKSGINGKGGEKVVAKLTDALKSGLEGEAYKTAEKIIQNPSESGLSFTDKVYMFITPHSNAFALLAKVDDEGKVEALLEALKNEPKYGLCVSGFVHPKKIFKNYGCKPGDVLILTKQVGTGIVNTAIKGEMASAAAIREAEIVMSSLNKKAKEVVEHFPVNACTDITGFGLLGHCVEMAEASNVTFELNVHDIAYLDEAISYAKMGLVPAGAYKNKGYSYQKVDFRNVEDHFIDLLYDPQTSGGLLISVEAQYAEAVMEAFEKKRLDTKVSLIGTVTEKSDKLIRLH